MLAFHSAKAHGSPTRDNHLLISIYALILEEDIINYIIQNENKIPHDKLFVISSLSKATRRALAKCRRFPSPLGLRQ